VKRKARNPKLEIRNKFETRNSGTAHRLHRRGKIDPGAFPVCPEF